MLAVFGKLPARRDFIAREVPNPVLERIEPWLQESIAQSRATLGPQWLNAYLNAPLWRFWWSNELAGAGLAGALMPSVDKMGRYFPLLAFAIAPKGEAFALPSQSDDAWYGALETALLGALADGATLEDVLAGLAKLDPSPPLGKAADRRAGSLWWTIGGVGEPPRSTSFAGLPPPYAFTTMLKADAASSQDPHPPPRPS